MSGEQAETTAMSGGVERLCEQLRDVVETLRRSGGGVVLENFPGALKAEPESDELDRLEPSRVRVAPDAVAAAQRTLVDAADELAETLAQLEGTAWRIHPLRARPQ
jgi:hypothetical protein